MADEPMLAPQVARAGERACGTCTLCCKLMEVRDLGKDDGVWCKHVLQGRGCGIYQTRPESCRTFLCGWISTEALDEASAAKAFDTLVLVLPRRSLGELRPMLSRRVAARVSLEVAKDLSTQTMTALWKQLSPKLAAG